MKRVDAIYKRLQGERWTPFSLAKKLNAKAVLESASFAYGRDRFSLLMIEEAFRIIEDKNGVAFIINGERKNADFARESGDFIESKNLKDSKDSTESLRFTDSTNSTDSARNATNADSKDSQYSKDSKDILDILEYVANQNNIKRDDIPLPAAGIGYLGYEFCTHCDTINLASQDDELEIPQSEFIIGHIYVIFDHFSEQLHIFALNYNEHSIDLKNAIDTLEKTLNNLDFSYLEEESPSNAEIITNLAESKASFISKVETLKEHITKGDLLQAVPSRRLQIKSKASALEAYRKLRSINPSPYLFYIDFGAYQLVGASPESLVRVRGKNASVRPIAGTIRRGKNNAEDEKLKLELLSNPKEKAEHLMLVDLARNDLGRVADNIQVNKFMQCEIFSHVIHLVSEVSGVVRENTKSTEVLRSAFPAGTLSGAPKIKAIELVSNLESKKRNFYAGAVGYIDIKGGLDFCIAIRTALKKGDIWTLQAGAGIVYDSQAEREWEETNEKLGSMLAALGLDSSNQKL